MLSFRREEEKTLSEEDKAIAVYMLQYNLSWKDEDQYPISLWSFVFKQVSHRLRHKLDLNTGYLLKVGKPFRIL